MVNMKSAAKAGEKAIRTMGTVLPRLAPLGKALAVISGTMAVLTAVGWFITRANEKKTVINSGTGEAQCVSPSL